MKNSMSKRLSGGKFLFAALLVFALTTFAAAQESFRVGDEVETNDGRQCRVMSITGRSAKVSCGSNRSDIRVFSFESLVSAKTAALRREQQQELRNAAINSQPAQTQTVSFREGDAVLTPDGRTGKIDKISDFENPGMARVRFGPGASDTQYFMLQDLKKPVDPNAPTFRVGDRVALKSTNGEGVILEFSPRGDGAKVKTGPGKYDFQWVAFTNLITPQQAAVVREREKDELKQKPIRAQFNDEAKPFYGTIQLVAPSFNPKILRGSGSGFNPTPATYEAWRKDLEALAVICQKYPSLTNQPFADEPTYANNINYRQGDWCEMARQRDTLIKGFLKDVGSDQLKDQVTSVKVLLNEAERNPDGYIGDELQTVLFDRAAWSKKLFQSYKTQFGLTDAEIETKVFTSHAGKIGELKAKIESDSLNPGPPLPSFSDAALAGVVKSTFAKGYPGGQVLKVGLDSANWSVRDGRQNIGSNSAGTQYYLRIKGAYRIRTGRAIVRMPNQPYCQIRYIELTQPKKGAGFDAAWAMVESRGKYVKCP